MNCFYHFKDRIKSRVQRSAPILKNPKKSNVSEQSECISQSSRPARIPELYEERAHNLRVFRFSELKQATNNFSRLLKIGEGGFGCVYKGSIKPVDGLNGDPLIVAIKKLDRDGSQVSEIMISSKFKFIVFVIVI